MLVYTQVPHPSLASGLASLAGVTAVVLIVWRVRRFRPEKAGAWYLIAGGLLLWAAGDGTLAVDLAVLGRQPFPSWADLAWVGAHPLLIAGLYGLTRRPGKQNLPSLLDAGVVATGLGLLYWVGVIGPVVTDHSMPALDRLVTVLYPTFGVLLLAVLVPLVSRFGRPTPSFWMLVMSCWVAVIGNFFYTLMPDRPDFVTRLILATYLFAYICVLGAVLQPSAMRIAGAAPPERFGRRRLVVLAGSTLLVPVILVIEGVYRAGRVDWLAVAIGSIVLFLLVLARMSGFVRTVQVQAGQLADLALRDELTGLPNRRALKDALRAAMRSPGTQVAMLDLNGFKDVNDRFGHAAGDRLLVAVAERLARSLRGNDLVARMGGDEFAVLVAGATPAAMAGIVERLLAALRRPVEVDGHDLLIGGAVGVGDNSGTDDPWEVLRRADVAMYAAKSAGEGTSRRYDPDMDHRAGERARLGVDLRAALGTGQFRLVYQPIVSLPDGRVQSVEALVRWEHPERGFVGPAEFIPVAEENGLIVELGEWILRTACAQAVTWRDEYGDDAPKRMSVNVSARQLAEPGFSELVTEVLAWTGLGAHNLIVEVTETAVFGGGQAVRAVQELHELGVRLALDDFGTGHSSLGLLQTVPVDILKVDKSFVDNITMAGRHAVIATALIQVSDGLGLMAVAEGVETAEQATELHRLGYRLAQGYHFGRPAAQPDFPHVAAATG